MIFRTAIWLLLFSICFFSSNAQPVTADHWESVIYAGDEWHYFVNTSGAPAAGWYHEGFDDSSWLTGNGGFGYADSDDATELPNPPYPMSVHTRISFDIADTSEIVCAVLSMDYDDGFIAWINGIEIARSNMGEPGTDPAVSMPSTDHEAFLYRNLDPPNYMIYKNALSSCLKNGTNILAVQVNNFGTASSDLSCIPYLSVGMKTPVMRYRTVPYWFDVPFTGFVESDLPLIMIETHGISIPSDEKANVDFGIIDNGPVNKNHPADPRNGYQGKAGIEYRGSSSMGFPKRNFGIETRTISGMDSAVSLLGFPAEADWTLHGPYSDKTLVRNRLAYDLSRGMGHYAPRAQFCELFIDDQYQGVYVLIEKIKRDDNRVNISRLDTADVFGHDLTGGYIIKIDRSSDGSYTDGWFSNYRGRGTDASGPFFAWHYPKREEILPVQMTYIRNRVTKFEDALFGEDFINPFTGYRNYIDIHSFVDYFILVELSKNTDGYRLSTFLYKDRDDIDPRLHMGPVWDYDLAFGNANYYEASEISGWNYLVSSDGWGTPLWWTRFLSDPYFVNNLNCRWNVLRQGILSDESLITMVDSYVDTIGEAQIRNFAQWPIHGMYVWPNAYVGNTYDDDVAFMKNWILDRAAWIDNNLPGTCTVSLPDNNRNVSFMISVRPNPSVASINLEIQNPEYLDLEIQVMNITGSIVYTEFTGNSVLFNRSIDLPRGIYLVKVSGGGSFRMIKALVQ